MKRLIYALVLASLTSLVGELAVARPGAAYGPAGCGLGNMIFGKKDSQVLASTTNGSSGSQTFGISSGTSNCTDSGLVSAGKDVTLFIELNQTTLASEISKGGGESVSSLAYLMDCQDRASFANELQRNYQTIFPASGTSPLHVESAVRQVIRESKSLAGTCSLG